MLENLNILSYLHDTDYETYEESKAFNNLFGDSYYDVSVIPKGYVSEEYKEDHSNTVVKFQTSGIEKKFKIENDTDIEYYNDSNEER